jgi:FkbM family methyltransferase
MSFYSQCGEDKFLNDNYFKNKKNGIYIELGAVDGIFQSNTKFFEDNLNWKGILIEPNENQFELLKINRPNNYLFNDLVSCSEDNLEYKWLDNVVAVAGVSSTLSQMHNDTWYGSFVEEHKLKINTKLIKPKSLTEIIKSTDIKYVDFLSLDVEGHEYEVLKSYDFSIPINVILIEMLGVNKQSEELCREILIKNGYKFDSIIAHNEVYILKK